jgi:signal peptidase II
MTNQMIKNKLFWIVAIAGLILDQISKYAMLKAFAYYGDPIYIWENVFHLTYVENDGAAFNRFPGGVIWLKWLSLFVSIGLMVLAWKTPKMSKKEKLGYGFILAGALGNGIDRFLLGYVIDFLHFSLINFPVFNIADVCVNIGIVFLVIILFSSTSETKKHHK